MLAPFFCQRREKYVDGVVQSARRIVGQDQLVPLQGHILFGWDQVNGIRLDGHPIFGLVDGHFRVLAQNIGHKALIIWGKVLNHDKTQPAVGGHVTKKLLQCLQSAGRGADANQQRCLGGGSARLSGLP